MYALNYLKLIKTAAVAGLRGKAKQIIINFVAQMNIAINRHNIGPLELAQQNRSFAKNRFKTAIMQLYSPLI